MGRALRIIQVILGTVAGLIVVPVAVNIGTGGSAPGWLKPFAGWLWPVAIACVLGIIAVEIADKLRGPDGVLSAGRGLDPRNVGLALDRVGRYVAERRQGALAERIRMAMDERPGAVLPPANLVQRVSGTDYQLSDEFGIADVFDEMHESMLILGAPGAGKTTQLLDLATALVERARRDPDAGIPVVVDLASWARGRRGLAALLWAADAEPRDFADWLVASMRERYRIPEHVGLAWLREDRFVLLLDGLDEVPAGDRERCVTEINALQQRLTITRLVVCSREMDYDQLAGRLHLQGAVVIRPLTRDQVTAYLHRVSPHLSGVAAALHGDEQLWELLSTPLMLAVMALAQSDRTWRALADQGDAMSRRRLLFDAYVIEVLARPRTTRAGDPQRVLVAMRTLAANSVELNKGVLIAEPAIDKIKEAVGRDAYTTGGYWLLPLTAFLTLTTCTVVISARVNAGLGLATFVALGGIGVALWIDQDAELRPRVDPAPILGFAFGTAGLALAVSWVAGVLASAVRGLPPLLVGAGIAGVAVLASYFVRTAVDRSILLLMGVGGTLFGVVVGLVGAPQPLVCGWASGLAETFCLVPPIGLWTGWSAARRPSEPDVKDVGSVLVAFYCVAGLIVTLVAGSTWKSFWWAVAGWIVGVGYALFPATFLVDAVKRLATRASMAAVGEETPWRRSFLRFATDRSLLTHDGHEYRFVHLLVRDHLAECDPERLAPAVHRRRAELTAMSS